MTEVWINDIDAPNQVEPGDSFYILLEIKYRTWPWWLGGKLRVIFSNFNKDGIMLDERRTSFWPWWFWGTKKHSYEVHNINETSTYYGDVGYGD